MCKSQACFSTLKKVHVISFIDEPGPVMHNVHDPCMFLDSELEHPKKWDVLQVLGRSETHAFYIGLHVCTVHNSMHDTGIFHAQHLCIPWMYHPWYMYISCVYMHYTCSLCCMCTCRLARMSCLTTHTNQSTEVLNPQRFEYYVNLFAFHDGFLFHTKTMAHRQHLTIVLPYNRKYWQSLNLAVWF